MTCYVTGWFSKEFIESIGSFKSVLIQYDVFIVNFGQILKKIDDKTHHVWFKTTQGFKVVHKPMFYLQIFYHRQPFISIKDSQNSNKHSVSLSFCHFSDNLVETCTTFCAETQQITCWLSLQQQNELTRFIRRRFLST